MNLEEKKEEAKLTIITALGAAQVLSECLDTLKDTDFYKSSLKVASKQMEQQLSRLSTKYSDELWSIDSDTMLELLAGISAVTKELATLNPNKIIALGALFKSKEIEFEG